LIMAFSGIWISSVAYSRDRRTVGPIRDQNLQASRHG